jgi:hypothetical protein
LRGGNGACQGSARCITQRKVGLRHRQQRLVQAPGVRQGLLKALNLDVAQTLNPGCVLTKIVSGPGFGRGFVCSLHGFF